MDDFTVYGSSFDVCLDSLEKVLHRCTETNLVLNFEKCYFMVEQGIVLGHIISDKGIEVDPANFCYFTIVLPLLRVRGAIFSWSCRILQALYKRFQQGSPSTIQLVAKGGT